MRTLIAIFSMFFATPAISANIAIALTDDLVRVDTGFDGARLVLFGAVTGIDNPETLIDIVSVVRGPDAPFSVRHVEKRNLIWMPGEAQRIERAPGLYVTTSTKRLTDIAPLPDQAAYRLGADFLDIKTVPLIEPETTLYANDHATIFKNAFLSEFEDRGLYKETVGGVEFKKSGLFIINVDLPATTPVGDYDVFVYLYRNGELLAGDTAQLAVNKVGMERRIYELAHNRPVSYGVFCVIISLLAGWFAAFAFRK